ncbi:hypothetical protein BaRGS_00018364 [Batillaria attramentaria]|uniref:Uncharacterized protein n=1 Tax=Batillaria attramentaria TaxID=370345 RepID=A0ABD0KT76_9CAEN
MHSPRKTDKIRKGLCSEKSVSPVSGTASVYRFFGRNGERKSSQRLLHQLNDWDEFQKQGTHLRTCGQTTTIILQESPVDSLVVPDAKLQPARQAHGQTGTLVPQSEEQKT